MPEAQDLIMKTHAFAFGMETDVLVAVCITSLSLLTNSHPQDHAIL
jgi:hypothetical protein